jgi:tRNA threonylcarbamoyl adenosine modification protein (Sua5/YciO/YrdC/YwlC family)
MEVITKEQVRIAKDEIEGRIQNGEIFIHPTDTIYGLGCNAENSKAVIKIRDVKGRDQKPFSVIAPSKQWIIDNCYLSNEEKKWVAKLPGPYTLILKLKNKDCIASETNMGLDTIGVRIPAHWFSEIVRELGIPIVTTSANMAGQDFMTSIDNLDPKIARKTDFAIYEGEKKGKPSTLINLTEDREEALIIKR